MKVAGSGTDHVIYREYPCPALQLTTPPVLISTIYNFNDISLLERKFPGLGRLKGVQGPHTGDDACGHRCSSCSSGSVDSRSRKSGSKRRLGLMELLLCLDWHMMLRRRRDRCRGWRSSRGISRLVSRRGISIVTGAGWFG